MSLLLSLLLLQSGDLPAKRDRVAPRVEEIRGVRFASPVTLREGSRKECGTRALEQARLVYGADLAACERALKTLGLIPDKLRLELALGMFAMQLASAYQDDREVALVNLEAGDDELVYRMTCSLADQRHRIAATARALGPSFDSQMALAAVRQGDGEMTKQLFWAGKKLDEKLGDRHIEKLRADVHAWEREASRYASMVAPRIFVRAGNFGFRRGGLFMETLRHGGGMGAVESAYVRLPESTEQVLHPEKYLAAETPVALLPARLDAFLAAQGYRPAWRTTLGELGTAILLETHLEEEHAAVPPGWGGDLLTHYENPNGPSFAVWATAWDSERDAGEFESAIRSVGRKLSSPDPKSLTLAVRRGTSVALVLHLPWALQDGALDALWKCIRMGPDVSTPYGRR